MMTTVTLVWSEVMNSQIPSIHSYTKKQLLMPPEQYEYERIISSGP